MAMSQLTTGPKKVLVRSMMPGADRLIVPVPPRT